MGLDTKTYWLTDRQSQCNFDFDFDDEVVDGVQRSIQQFARVVSELAAAEMARKELDCAKKTSRVIRNHSEIVIKPLPGYD
jgi:hypothetical protein